MHVTGWIVQRRSGSPAARPENLSLYTFHGLNRPHGSAFLRSVRCPLAGGGVMSVRQGPQLTRFA